MKTKIAVFGRGELIDRLRDYSDNQNDIEIIPFEYSETKEITHLIDQAFMCDSYVFLEPLPYLYAKDYLKKRRLPMINVSLDEYMILTTFYKVKNIDQKPLHRFSIDILNKSNVDEVIAELNLNPREIYTYSYENQPINIQTIVHYHLKLWNEKKIDYVLTSIIEVKEQLLEIGVPTIFMHIPKMNIIDVIEKAKSVTALNKSKSTQIVAGYVQIKHLFTQQKDEEELLNELHDILQKFGRQTNSSVLQNNMNQFMLFGTRDMLDHITKHYRNFPLLRQIKELLNIEVDIGFGLGLTAKQAEMHAKIALKTCMESELGSCYIVNDRKDRIGPLGVKKHINTSRLYQALIHKARLNNELSYNFIDFITTRNNEPFSSHDVASFYKVTKRSAERTVNKLLSGEVIKVVGEEKPYTRGRPRKLFQIDV